MAFVLEGQTTFTCAAGSGNETKTLPGTPATGDIVIIVIAGDTLNEANDGVRGQGYTNLRGPAGTVPGRQICYKVMGATPDTTVDVGREASTMLAGLIQTWSGEDTTTPEDAAMPTEVAGNSAAPDPPQITTATNGALVLALMALDDDDRASGATAPSGYTNALFGDTGQASTTVGATVGIASLVKATAGAENPGTFGLSGSDQWLANTWALKPKTGQTVSVGQSTETDLAQAIAWAPKKRLVAQALETDLAQAITVVRRYAVGQSSETDLAQTVAVRRIYAVGQATEADAAQAITPARLYALAQTTETDLAQEITVGGGQTIVPVGQATETDTSQTITAVRRYAVGQAPETDVAQAITVRRIYAVGQATETDLAQANTPARRYAVAQVTETDLAQAVTVRRVYAVTQAIEADLAQTITVVRRYAVGQPIETDLGQVISSAKHLTVSQVLEADLAQPIQWAPKKRLVGQAQETDLAQPISPPGGHFITVNQALEDDLAQPFTAGKIYVIGQVLETDLAQAIAWFPQHRLLDQAVETDLAQPIIRFGAEHIELHVSGLKVTTASAGAVGAASTGAKASTGRMS